MKNKGKFSEEDLKYSREEPRGAGGKFDPSSSFILVTADIINVFTYHPQRNMFDQTAVDTQAGIDFGEELTISKITAAASFRVNI